MKPVNSLRISGTITSIESVTEQKAYITISQNAYNKFPTSLKVLIWDSNLYQIETLQEGDEILFDGVAIYHRDDSYHFRLDENGIVTKVPKPLDCGTQEAQEFWK